MLLITVLVVEGIAVAQKTQGKVFTAVTNRMFRTVDGLFERTATFEYYFRHPSGVFQ